MKPAEEDYWFAAELQRVEAGLGRRVNAEPERLENGLAGLVLAVVEQLRQIMEHQAIRRIDAGDLDAEEIERLGRVFLAFADRMDELKTQFGLRDEDLNLNPGPLRELMWDGHDGARALGGPINAIAPRG